MIDAKSVSGDINSGILTFAAFASVDEFTRPDGWRRLPVDDIASVFGVTREAVRQHLVALQARGCIERKIETNSHEGRWRKDSLVRLL